MLPALPRLAIPSLQRPVLYCRDISLSVRLAPDLVSLSFAQGEALHLFGELGQRIANSYAGFISGAASALLQIVKGGVDYSLQVLRET